MWGNLKRQLWEWRGVWISAPSIAVLVILVRFLGLLQAWEWAVYDQYMRRRPLEPPDKRIAIVGIDEEDVQKLDLAFIPDGLYAKLLLKLKAMQPRAIGLDVYKDVPVEPGHKQLLQVFESTPNLVGIEKVVGDSRREAVSALPELKAKKGQVGANDGILDANNKVRRAFLYVADRNKQNVFSFGFILALHYLEKEGVRPKQVEGTKNWQLGKQVFTRFQPNDGGYVRADAGGYQILLNYRGPSRYFETVSMTDILDEKVPPDWGRDRVILIGKVGESFQDLVFTPHSSGLLSLPERMAGVEVHANLTSQIISAALDGRPPIRSWDEPYEWLWILLWSGVGATLTWTLRYVGGVKSFSIRRTAGPFIAGGGLVVSSYVAFLWGWWIPVVPPLLALSGSAIAITAYIARSAGHIRQTFGRYLTDQVVAQLLESPEGLKLGGERRKITIFTSDLRGFTATSERLQPEEVVKILNFYLGYMADVITKYQGTIDEFMGDGILVLFGAPTAREDDAKRAIACAINMQLVMGEVNKQMKEWGLPPLEMGIGINTGEVVVGNIGSEKRTKYGIVGSQVNLTYRIESYTTGGQVIISESTLLEAGSIVKIDGQKEVQPKGVQQPITIYEVGGIGGEYNLYLSKEEEIFFPVTEEIPLEYALLDGKNICDITCRASIVKLSAKGAEVRRHDGGGDAIPPALTNIKLNFAGQNNPGSVSEDIYAKVVEKPAGNSSDPPENEGSFYIYFTAKSPAVQAKLDELYNSIKG